MPPEQPLPGIGIHDPLHGRQACSEFNSFHQGLVKYIPARGFFMPPPRKKGTNSRPPPPPPFVEQLPRILPFRRSLFALVVRKQTVVRDKLFPQKPSCSRPWFLRTGVSTPLTRRRSNCLRTSPILVRTHPIECFLALRDSAPCLSRATNSQRAPN